MPTRLDMLTASTEAGSAWRAVQAGWKADQAKPATVVGRYELSFGDHVASVCPGFPFTRHTERLIEIGQRVLDGKLKRGLVMLPPRHYKSTVFSRLLPSCYVRHNPSHTIGLGAHTQTLANEFSEAARGYYLGSGGLVSPSTSGKEYWKTAGDIGGMWAAGVGKGTGLPANGLIVDDPTKGREEADSAAHRRQLHNWIDGVLSTRLEPDAWQLYIHCLTGDTPVAMADGSWKPMEEIRAGDFVKAWKNGYLVDRKILNHASQGEDEVFEIRTGNHCVKANAKHPFLVKHPNGQTEWKKTADLIPGDRLVCSGAQSYEVDQSVSLCEAWLLGYMFGDGWLTVRDTTQTDKKGRTYPRRGFVTCCAAPKPQAMREKVLYAFDLVFGIAPKLTRFGYWRTDIARVGRFFQKLGFSGKSKTKRLPRWLFSQPLPVRREFLQGYLDSDGTVISKGPNTGRWKFACSNLALLQDVRHLARSCGFMPSNVTVYNSIVQPPNSPEPVASTIYSFGVEPSLQSLEPFKDARIRTIKPAGRAEVFDIQVEDAECFLADGLVSHNTRWHELDAIGYKLSKVEELEAQGLERLAEKWHVIILPIEAEPLQIALPRTVTKEPDERKPGEALDPTRYDEEWIEKTKANTPDRDWEAIYQQRPSAGTGSVFLRDTFRYFAREGEELLAGDIRAPKRFNRVVASLDCTFKDSAGTDMVGLGLWGQDPSGYWLLDVIDQRMDFPTTLGTVKALHPTWGFTELFVEDKANGSAVIAMLRSEAAGFIIHEVKPLGGKVARANAASITFKAGRVFFPRWAPWLPAYEKQLLQFPSGSFDDQVDQTTQLINGLEGTGPMSVSTVHFGHGVAQRTPDVDSLRRDGWSENAIIALQSGMVRRK